MQELGEEFSEDLKHAEFRLEKLNARQMSFDLFEQEETVIARGRAVEAAELDVEASRAAFTELLKDYERLFKNDPPPRAPVGPQRGGAQRNGRETPAGAEEIARKNKELEVLSGKLAKYLSPQVYKSIFTGAQEVKLASQRKKLTVFFSDIAGFAEMTDKMESEDLTNLLNHYLTEMSKVALEYGATIDKYVGDCDHDFLRRPGNPRRQGRCARMCENGHRHAEEDARACRRLARVRHRDAASMSDRDSYRLLHGRQFRQRGPDGLHHHRAPVNLASRLEHEATIGGILISYETHALVKDQIHCEARGHIRVKGITHPVVVYEAMDHIENIEPCNRPLNADLPHFRLEFDPRQMSAEEQHEAQRFLRDALARVSWEGASERKVYKQGHRKPTDRNCWDPET